MASGREKILLIFIIGYLYSGVDAASFEFNGGTGSACILVNMDATFNLSRVYNFNQTEIAEPFNLEGANVTAVQSKCGTDTVEALLTLSLSPSTDMLKLKFVKVAGLPSVYLSVVLNVQLLQHFNDSSLPPFIEMEDDGDLPVGERSKSFTCMSQQTMSFGQDPGYFMTMKISNMQVQGYDVENGQFSPALECPQDSASTTPAPTTQPEPVTTEDITVTLITETTSAETPASIEPETTSSGTPASVEPETTSAETPSTVQPETTLPATTNPPITTPEQKIPKYDVKDGNIECIVMEGDIEFAIKYMTADQEQKMQSFKIPPEVTVSGKCSVDGSESAQEITIAFFDGWSFVVQIEKPVTPLFKSVFHRNLLADEETYSWKKLSLNYVVDDQRFENPDPSELGPKTEEMTEEAGIFAASTQGSYKCTAGESVALSDTVTMDVTNLQYRAFGETDEDNFPTEDVAECAADHDDDDDDDDDTTAIVLGSVFGGLALIILLLIIVIVIRRRKSRDYEVM